MEPLVLIDGEIATRRIVALWCVGRYRFTYAGTAKEGQEVLLRDPPSLVLLEYRLPDGSGLELLRQIKFQRPGLPVIMVTAYGSESVCAAALKVGVRDYFLKPFDPTELFGSIGQILAVSSHGAHRENAPQSAQNQPARSPSLAAHPHHVAVQRAAQLIHERYWDKLSLLTAAQEAAMSRFALSRAFRIVMRVSFREYLLRQRVSKAKELLESHQYSVTEVAHMVGFGDLPRFDKVFRKHIGLSPSAYRKSWLARAKSQLRPKNEQQTTSNSHALVLAEDACTES